MCTFTVSNGNNNVYKDILERKTKLICAIVYQWWMLSTRTLVCESYRSGVPSRCGGDSRSDAVMVIVFRCRTNSLFIQTFTNLAAAVHLKQIFYKREMGTILGRIPIARISHDKNNPTFVPTMHTISETKIHQGWFSHLVVKAQTSRQRHKYYF